MTGYLQRISEHVLNYMLALSCGKLVEHGIVSFLILVEVSILYSQIQCLLCSGMCYVNFVAIMYTIVMTETFLQRLDFGMNIFHF